MIPTVAAAQLALQPYLLWIKLAVYAAIVATIFGAGWKTGSSLTTARWEHAAAKQAADYQESLKRAIASERASYAQRDEVSRDLQKDLAAVQAERDRLRRQSARVVRVYVPAPAGSVPADGGTAPRHGGAPGPAEPTATAGPDIGRDLYDLADDGDAREAELRARVNRCVEGWAAAASR